MALAEGFVFVAGVALRRVVLRYDYDRKMEMVTAAELYVCAGVDDRVFNERTPKEPCWL
jgi:hypothetical protein